MANTGVNYSSSNSDKIIFLSNNIIPTSPPEAGVDTVILLNGTTYGWNGLSWNLISGTNTSSTPSASILDNTIANPLLATDIGRYIVPAIGTSGVYIGQENNYDDWDGVTHTFTVPTTGDKVSITTGPNAGKIFEFDGTTWVLQGDAPVNTDTNSLLEVIRTGTTLSVPINTNYIFNTVKTIYGSDVSYSTSTGIATANPGIYEVGGLVSGARSLWINGVEDITSGTQTLLQMRHFIILTKTSTIELRPSAATVTLAIQNDTVESNFTIKKIAAYVTTLTSLSAGTASSVVDLNSTQTVTFTLPATAPQSGITGTPLVTTTYPYITSISNYSNPVYNTITGTVTFTANVTTTNNPTLNVPNTLPISYNVTIDGFTAVASSNVITDAIVPLLSTSLSGYNSLSANGFVQATQAEYNNMLNLQSATKFGLNDATMALTAGAQYAGNWTLTYPNDATKITDMPANSFLVAFSVRLSGGTGVSFLPKISSQNAFGGATNTYNPVGTQTTPINVTNTQLYFIRKWATSSVPDNATVANMAMAIIGGTGITFGRAVNVPMALNGAVANTSPVILTATAGGWQFQLQGISTTIKQG